MTYSIPAMIRMLRPVQWIKNVFVLAPLFFGFRAGNFAAIVHALLAVGIFSLVSSAVYIFNDLRDISADRSHPKKRVRPLASGEVTPGAAVTMLIILLLCVALTIRLGGLNLYFAATIIVYVTINAAYSLGLKNIALLELFFVASGYVLRVIAGCIAVDVVPSQWLLGATSVLALLLVTGKRRAEIAEQLDVNESRKSLRGYNLTFLDSMLSMLGSITIITYLMFTVSSYAIERYASQYLMLSSVFVAYGVLRYLQVVKTATGADMPTELVTRDPWLIGAIALWGMFMAVELYF